jgi:hypothetical protein
MGLVRSVPAIPQVSLRTLTVIGRGRRYQDSIAPQPRCLVSVRQANSPMPQRKSLGGC